MAGGENIQEGQPNGNFAVPVGGDDTLEARPRGAQADPQPCYSIDQYLLEWLGASVANQSFFPMLMATLGEMDPKARDALANVFLDFIHDITSVDKKHAAIGFAPLGLLIAATVLVVFANLLERNFPKVVKAFKKHGYLPEKNIPNMVIPVFVVNPLGPWTMSVRESLAYVGLTTAGILTNGILQSVVPDTRAAKIFNDLYSSIAFCYAIPVMFKMGCFLADYLRDVCTVGSEAAWSKFKHNFVESLTGVWGLMATTSGLRTTTQPLAEQADRSLNYDAAA